MILYSINALAAVESYNGENVKIQKLFTYDDFKTLEDARRQVEIWKKYNYNIIFWYIEKYEPVYKDGRRFDGEKILIDYKNMEAKNE